LSVCPCISSNYDTIDRENKQLVVHSVTSPLALVSPFVVKCYCTLNASPPPSVFLLLDFLKLLIFVDFKKELRSLNRELQLHILELADVLVERPSQYARRVEEISLIFKNLHHLLNSLRPHQAQATLIHILELQIQHRKQAVEDIKRRREEARKLLKESIATLDGN
ncbi:mediator of RNA polymerase II transcription subunit 7b-like, partial [Quercus robur]|uniref:mediator of RNA polymerase II transcription subunit 7b-like n=1 Tax=Quercus robur TaxID=38942 RepID=UPI0021638B1C